MLLEHLHLPSITVAEGNTTYHSEGNCLIETATDRLVLGCKTSVIPAYTTSIGDWAFYYCMELPSVTLPSFLTRIGTQAFKECESLASITFTGTLAEWAAVEKEDRWAEFVPAEVVHCMDGDAPIEEE